MILPDLLKNAPSLAALSGQPASGETHPVWLHYLATPLIAHGRWALQSPVNLLNAHPFSDASGLRSIVLNGQFSTRVETEVHDFLERVCGHTFRSGNSSEYLALLWGHYAKLLQEEKERYQAIDTQVDAALQDYNIGSQTIDHRVYREIKDKSPSDLDEQAFLEAARRMVRDGGQIAAAGISLQSPRRLYVAVHNRPALVVQRADGNDFMVVSDINAAVGLFPQRLIHKKAVALREAHHEYRKASRELEESGADKAALESCEEKYRDTESAILKAFEIVVYPLEGEEIFARIEAGFEKGRFRRNARITDFQGNRRPGVKPFRTVLNPLRTRKDLFRSFYESHLHEIPERLGVILRNYARDEQGPPHFELRHRLLHRRFGQRLTSLKRILLVGMGSAHNTGLMARDFLQSRLPDQEILVLRPIEIENVPAAIVPEQDLVVLLSWSSTTADMVQFAKDLEAHHVVMLGITEKSFADMALVARKSAGVIQVLSGEEVTVAAIKSTLCMLMCVELFGLWLMSQLGKTEEAVASLDKLRRMPEMLAEILEHPSVEEFSKELASRSAKSTVCLVFDALESTAAGHEIAGKLQDNSWYALGKCLDYRDLWIHEGPKDMNRELVLVNATHQGRLREALNVMKRLYMGGVPFAAVGYEHPEEDEVRYFSNDLCLNLPKLDDDLQPFADLMFYYRFAYQYGLAHGRTAEDAPRNRSKSVTVTRSRPKRIPSPSEELRRLEDLVPKTEPGTQLEPLSRETLWEREACFEVEKRYYREMRRLADLVSRKELSGTIFQSPSQSLTKLNKAIFEDLPEEGGEVVFVSLDRSAHAAAKNLVSRWGRFLRYFLRVAPGGESLSHFKEDTILIFIATRPPEESVLAKLREQIFVPCLWFGPEIPQEFARFFHASLGCFTMPPAEGLTENDLLYAGLSCLIVSSWRDKRPEKARIVEEHFAQCGRAVQAILNDGALRRAALDAMAENRDYPSAYFSVPPGGTGLAWVVRFDELGCLALEQHCYGETAYGPLVTVDPRVDKKFVALQPVSEMVARYGEERVSEWERRYLGDLGIDAFLEQPTADLSCRIEKPFFAEGRWYLPALRPDYDVAEDTLIIIDAAVHRRFDRALDELATYGVRYARMLIVSQRAFFQEQQKSLACQPMDRLLLLPTLEGYTDEAVPIPEILLPFAMNLLAVQLCAAAAKARDLPFEPVSRDAVFLRCFGPLGDLINRDRLDLDYFHSRLIEPLRHLTPVMHSLEGTGRYSVLEIRDEDRLHRLADEGLLYNPDATVEHFRAQQSLAPPFFLVRPNRETFDARILECRVPNLPGRRLEHVARSPRRYLGRALPSHTGYSRRRSPGIPAPAPLCRSLVGGRRPPLPCFPSVFRVGSRPIHGGTATYQLLGPGSGNQRRNTPGSTIPGNRRPFQRRHDRPGTRVGRPPLHPGQTLTALPQIQPRYRGPAPGARADPPRRPRPTKTRQPRCKPSPPPWRPPGRNSKARKT